MKTLKLALFMGLIFPSFVFAQSFIEGVEIENIGSDSVRNKVGNVVELGKFRIENKGKKKELHSIYFKNYGRADLDKSIEQAVLLDSYGEVVATGRTNNKSVQFVFGHDSILGERDTKVFRIQARLIRAERNDFIQLGIQRQEDLRVTDLSSGFGVPTNAENIRLSKHELHPGDIYFSSRQSPSRARSYRGSYQRRLTPNTAYNRSYRPTYRSSGSSTQRTYNSNRHTRSYSSSNNRLRTTNRRSYTQGARDVLFFNQYVSSNRNISVDGVFFEVSGLTSSRFEHSFGDLNLYINGSLEATRGVFETRNGKQILLFNESIDIPSGQHQWQVSGRIKNTAQNNDRLRLRLTKDGFLDKEYY